MRGRRQGASQAPNVQQQQGQIVKMPAVPPAWSLPLSKRPPFRCPHPSLQLLAELWPQARGCATACQAGRALLLPCHTALKQPWGCSPGGRCLHSHRQRREARPRDSRRCTRQGPGCTER